MSPKHRMIHQFQTTTLTNHHDITAKSDTCGITTVNCNDYLMQC